MNRWEIAYKALKNDYQKLNDEKNLTFADLILAQERIRELEVKLSEYEKQTNIEKK